MLLKVIFKLHTLFDFLWITIFVIFQTWLSWLYAFLFQRRFRRMLHGLRSRPFLSTLWITLWRYENTFCYKWFGTLRRSVFFLVFGALRWNFNYFKTVLFCFNLLRVLSFCLNKVILLRIRQNVLRNCPAHFRFRVHQSFRFLFLSKRDKSKFFTGLPCKSQWGNLAVIKKQKICRRDPKQRIVVFDRRFSSFGGRIMITCLRRCRAILLCSVCIGKQLLLWRTTSFPLLLR